MSEAEFIPVHEAKDIVALAALAHDIWNEYFPAIIGQRQVDYMVGRFQSEAALSEQIAAGDRYFFIRRRGEDMGYAGLVFDADARAVQISKLYLSDAARGGGLGRKALAKIIDLARGEDARLLWLTVNKYNAGAIRFYEKTGFRNVAEIVMDIGEGYIMDDFRMEKSIA